MPADLLCPWDCVELFNRKDSSSLDAENDARRLKGPMKSLSENVSFFERARKSTPDLKEGDEVEKDSSRDLD